MSKNNRENQSVQHNHSRKQKTRAVHKKGSKKLLGRKKNIDKKSARKKHKSIGFKLRFGFLLLVWLLVFRGVQSTYQLHSVSASLQATFDEANYATTTILNTQNYITSIYSLMQNMTGRQELSDIEINGLQAEMKSLENAVFNNMQILEKLDISKELVSDLKLQFIAWNPIREEVVNLTLAGMLDVANRIAVDLSETHVMDLMQTIELTVGQLEEQSELARVANDAYVLRSVWFSGILILLLFVLSMIISNRVFQAILPPILKVSGAAKEISQGHLHVTLEDKEREDEIGDLVRTFDDTATYLRGCVGEIAHVLTHVSNKNLRVRVRNEYRGDFEPIQVGLETIISSINEMLLDITASVEVMSTTATSLGETSDDLMNIVKEQATGVEALTLNVQKVSTQAEGNMESAKGAFELSKEIQMTAVHGSDEMEELLHAIAELGGVSNKITSVLSSIENVAFQTNILALNAAVEAARAGEAGKGFAVVAEDVRRLALESSDAAEETRVLVEDSLSSIGTGTAAADRTAKSFRTITEGIEKSMQFSDNIYKASKTQNELIAEIEYFAKTMQDVSEKSKDISTINSSESIKLARQTKMLRKMTRAFRLRKEEPEYEDE
ncbi:MAG: methyl-accepting chemotaxis protein [Bacillota bacterium]